MIPDIEKVAGSYLRADSAVAAIVGRRIVGKTPSSVGEAWVRVTQLDARDAPDSRAEHLINYLLQFDCFAGYEPPDDAGHGQPEANLLARTVRDALWDMPGVHDDTVVTSVRFTGMTRIPDTDFEPARERVILTASIHAHA